MKIKDEPNESPSRVLEGSEAFLSADSTRGEEINPHISTVIRNTQFLFEELGQNGAIFVVRLRIEVVQTGLYFRLQEARENNQETHDDKGKSRLQSPPKRERFVVGYADGDIRLGLPQGLGAHLYQEFNLKTKET
jgi:hypothetical protein